MIEETTSACDAHASLAAALTEIYPRVLVIASHLRRKYHVVSVDVEDLSQDGLLSALSFGRRLPADRLQSLRPPERHAILLSVASRSMHGSLVDRLRRGDYERERKCLCSTDVGGASTALTPQESAADLRRVLKRQSGAARRVLECALRLGELDVQEICAQSGLSRGHVYKVLERLSAEERTTS